MHLKLSIISRNSIPHNVMSQEISSLCASFSTKEARSVNDGEGLQVAVSGLQSVVSGLVCSSATDGTARHRAQPKMFYHGGTEVGKLNKGSSAYSPHFTGYIYAIYLNGNRQGSRQRSQPTTDCRPRTKDHRLPTTDCGCTIFPIAHFHEHSLHPKQESHLGEACRRQPERFAKDSGLCSYKA